MQQGNANQLCFSKPEFTGLSTINASYLRGPGADMKYFNDIKLVICETNVTSLLFLQ